MQKNDSDQLKQVIDITMVDESLQGNKPPRKLDFTGNTTQEVVRDGLVYNITESTLREHLAKVDNVL